MNFNSFSKTKWAIVLSLITLTGCSHNIQLSPDLSHLRAVETSPPINKSVAYYISDANREKQVSTPGGGGDKVKYKPYAEIGGALNTVLLKVFSRAYSLDSVSDDKFLKDKNISFIFIPEITTNSSSSSPFTWPPTEFITNLSCEALNTNGETVWSKTVESKGNAEFDEFKADFSLSARRASEEAFTMLLKEIDKSDVFK